MNLSRRHFLLAAGAAGVGIAAFSAWQLRQGNAHRVPFDPNISAPGYGELQLDPNNLLNLPEGFRYTIVSRTGDSMSDGLFTPGRPDGMATFPVEGKPHMCRIVRNHELYAEYDKDGAFGDDHGLAAQLDRRHIYDHHPGSQRPLLGGTSTFLYDCRDRRVVTSHLSLAGTAVNCAGGATPWGSWLTCEETELMPGEHANRQHGWIFEVPAAAPGLVEPLPLKAMGRFRHEAAVVDEATGIVYLTEDTSDSLVYRFLPATRGRLADGGRLQALVIRESAGADTRNWTTDQGGAGNDVPVGKQLAVDWIDLDHVESADGDLRLRGRQAGAAIFARGEGMCLAATEHGQDIYFACTSGGPIQAGQVWRYTPSRFEGQTAERGEPGHLSLFFESRDATYMDMCDNIVAAPWGDLVICEDGRDEQFLRGITPEGKVYSLAHNAHRKRSEFCGACFSPDHTTLFVNVQSPGITFAIEGPWSTRRA